MAFANWLREYQMRERARQRAAETPGMPVPGTGRFSYHVPHRKMQPYERPRKGGGRHPAI